MAIIPLRNIGQRGVITDLDPFSPDPTSVSFAKNVRIADGAISRGPVFRTASTLAGDPGHLLSYLTASDTLVTLIVRKDGTVYDWSGGTETDKSPGSWSPSASDAAITSCELNNLVYINREDHVPWYRSKGSTGDFAEITTGAADWDSSLRCKSLRAFRGMLMAFNLVDGGSSYPNKVKWSNIVNSYDALPSDWDETSTTSSAGENTLAEMQGNIVDALPLRNRMMIYGTEETWFADYIGGNDIFRWDRAFNSGVINTNCVVEHNGVHYAFGSEDITVNDGISVKTLAHGRVQRFIFSGLISNHKHLCFTVHNKQTHEVLFCYSSGDSYCAFTANGTGCNRAAVYNYASDTWSFMDLPYVTYADLIAPSGSVLWSSVGSTWGTVGGSYSSQGGDVKLVLGFTSVAGTATARALRAFVPADDTSSVWELDTDATIGAYIERVGIDLDEIKTRLSGYKLISSVFPQCWLSGDAEPLRMTMGISDYASEAPYWGTEQTFDRLTYYKLDFNQAGRFLAYKIEQDDAANFRLSGFDADVVILGTF